MRARATDGPQTGLTDGKRHATLNNEMGTRRSKWLKLGLLLLGIVGGCLAVQGLGVRWSDLSPDRLRGYVLSFGWLAPVAYVLLYAQPIVPLPVTVVAMAGGLSFGMTGGVLLVWLAATLRACAQFLLAKLFGREAVASLLRGRLAALDASIGRKGFSTVLWIRLIPNVPFDVQNVSLGCSRVSFPVFALGTLVGIIPAVVVWVYAGHTLTDPRGLWRVVAVFVAILALWCFRRTLRVRCAGSGKSS